MKKIKLIILTIFTVLVISSCSSIYRVYNDKELQDVAVANYGFSEFLFFKIVDSETSYFMTGTRYQNSGVIVGIKNSEHKILFVPKRVAVQEFFVMETFVFNIADIYEKLNSLKDDEGNKFYLDPTNDYGGLSISVIPYESIIDTNPDIELDSELIFSFTTDAEIFYVGYSNQQIMIFDSAYEIIN